MDCDCDEGWPEGASVYTFMVHDGDWSGFYVNGYLVQEGHSLDVQMCLEELVGYEIQGYGHLYDKENRLGNLDQWGGRCPVYVDDLLKALR